MLVALCVALLTATYLIMGRRGSARHDRERCSLDRGRRPTVSVIIAAYRSEETIGKVLVSVRKLSYPLKEIIVVNDSDDRTPAIARSHGARVIHNRKRMGKPAALNMATRAARGELLFYLDADTTVSKDSLSRMVPWFSMPSVSVVMPKYLLGNPSPLSRLASLENLFTFALIRVHLCLGGIIGMRGCSILVRKSVIEKHPWPETLLEDNYLSAVLSGRGHRIIWEPDAVVHTDEPSSLRELVRQKTRWGEGAYLAFRDNWRFYLRSPQFMAFFYPYMLLGIVTGGLFLGLLFSGLVSSPLAPLLAQELALLMPAMYIHALIFIFAGGKRFMPVQVMLFVLLYFPVLEYSYGKGVLHGILRRKRNRPDLHFRTW